MYFLKFVFRVNTKEEVSEAVNKKVCTKQHNMSDIANIASIKDDEGENTAERAVHYPHEAVSEITKALETNYYGKNWDYQNITSQHRNADR